MTNTSGHSILWFAPSYGYGRHLMYFGEIFRALAALRPAMAVAVEKGRDIANPYGIQLQPIMRLARIAHRRRIAGADYDAAIAVPYPTSALALRRTAPDAVILIEFGACSLMATLATLGSQTARLLMVESDPATRGGRTGSLMLAVKRWIARRAHAVQTNNEAGRRFVVDTLGVPTEQVLVAPYLTSRPPGRDREAPTAGSPLCILFTNSLTERKNAALLLEALAACAPEVRQRVLITIVGDGAERAALEQRAMADDLRGLCRFVGSIAYDQLGQFYADADVLAIPSLADYRSLSGFEGLGYGLALLASTADGATAETVIEGETGFALDPLDQSAWTSAITRLATDNTLLARCRAGAKLRYEQHFSLKTIAENIAAGVDTAIAWRKSSRGADGA